MNKQYVTPECLCVSIKSLDILALSVGYGGNGEGRPAQTRERESGFEWYNWEEPSAEEEQD